METVSASFNPLVTTSKLLARRLLIIAGNRLELLAVEVQEARARLLHAFLLCLGVAAFGLLAALALTAALVVWLWTYSPVTVLLALTACYGLAALCLYRRLNGLLRNEQTLSATLDQLEKDRASLEQALE